MISTVIVIVIVIIIVVVAPAHALVVVLMLTVSHGVLFNDSSNSRRLSPAALFPALRRHDAGTKNRSAPQGSFRRASTGDDRGRDDLNILSDCGHAAA
jgi:hypothetical protein